MNKVLLIGNIGKDPEVKTFDWGKVAKFSLATTESYKNKKGEKITETEWHNCVFKGKVCDIIEQYVHKGDKIHVQGKIKIHTYKDKNQVDHWATEIICDDLEFIESKKKEEPEKKSDKIQTGAKSDINDLPGANESPENDPSYFPE
jgi:single-strand DNA-binding protein